MRVHGYRDRPVEHERADDIVAQIGVVALVVAQEPGDLVGVNPGDACRGSVGLPSCERSAARTSYFMRLLPLWLGLLSRFLAAPVSWKGPVGPPTASHEGNFASPCPARGDQARVNPPNHPSTPLYGLTVLQTDTRIGALSSGAAALAFPQLVAHWPTEAPAPPMSPVPGDRPLNPRELSPHTSTL